MEAEEFALKALDESEKDYGMFPPPTKAQDGLNILIDHFLGEDWYSVNPIHREQINTEAIYEILLANPRRSIKDKIKRFFKKGDRK